MAFERTRHFLDTFGEPRPPRPQIIPKQYRIPFYVALSIASLLLLVLLVWLVVIPGVRSHSVPRSPADSRIVPTERTP